MVTSADGPDEVYRADALHDLLPEADFLVVTLPLTDETRGLIGKRELALLPSNAVMVNVGRGPVVDEAALYNALSTGRLRAAGLDVWYNYPDDEASAASTQPSVYPFGELDNVVLSPHRGGAAEEESARRTRMDVLAGIINALARGEPVPNRVDLEWGY
jgi:phosphoglycerate dehydrogenase-like enzyme